MEKLYLLPLPIFQLAPGFVFSFYMDGTTMMKRNSQGGNGLREMARAGSTLDNIPFLAVPIYGPFYCRLDGSGLIS